MIGNIRFDDGTLTLSQLTDLPAELDLQCGVGKIKKAQGAGREDIQRICSLDIPEMTS